MTSDLAIRDSQTFWDDKQRAALFQLGVADASNADLAVFFHQVQRTRLDPFAKQIYMLGRRSKDRSGNWITKQTIQVGIDGYRLIAHRAAKRDVVSLGYEDTLWCGTEGIWSSVWTSSEPPVAAKVVVLRNGQKFPAVAHYDEYAQRTSKGEIADMWSRMARGQLAKCAEALALRKAFPQDLSGIYTDAEMHQSSTDEQAIDYTYTEPETNGRAAIEAAGEPAVDEATGEVKMITDWHHRKMRALRAEVGLKENDDFLPELSGWLEKEITSTKDLTAADAGVAIERLEVMANVAREKNSELAAK